MSPRHLNCSSALRKSATFRMVQHCPPRLRRIHVAAVAELPDWNLETFRQHAFAQSVPAKLPRTTANMPRACIEWFVHSTGLERNSGDIHRSELNSAFWSEHSDIMVPLELTGVSNDGNDVFHRTETPLKLLLDSLNHTSALTTRPVTQQLSIYLAQCDLKSLPGAIQQHLPTPELVLCSGKGDVYSSSLWMGRPPTYTPLHRDPNPNLFLQLAGHKVVRLFPPEVGDVIFDDVQQRLAMFRQGRRSSRSLRGEEMMQGPEKEMLHQAVWANHDNDLMLAHSSEAQLKLGEALFIPKGWWHSVKGVGEGVTASANWWFR